MILEEIRERLIEFDAFIQQNKNIEKRLPIYNMDDLKAYYNKVRDILAEKLKLEGKIVIPKMIEANKLSGEPRTTLIMNSNYREQNALINMFNKDLYAGYFDGSILQDGIFLPAGKSKYMENPPSYLYLDQARKAPNVDVERFKFLFDKVALIEQEDLSKSVRDNLRNHLFKTDILTPNEYALIKNYFLETAPFVLNCLLLKFKEEYITAKEENMPVILTSAMVNTGKNINAVFVLEALYNELLKQDIFKDTIFGCAVTSTSFGNTKYFNPILMDPTTECVPLKQYNLRLFINTHAIEDMEEKRLCYNSSR